MSERSFECKSQWSTSHLLILLIFAGVETPSNTPPARSNRKLRTRPGSTVKLTICRSSPTQNPSLADSVVRRLKAHPKPHQEIPPSPKKVKDSPKKTKTAKPTVSAAHPATAKQQSKSRPQPLRAVSPFRSTPAIDYFALQPPYAPATERPPTPPTPTPSGRKPRRATRTPRSLAAIDADDEEDESDENSDDAGPTQYAPESSIHRWWEYLDVDGPLLNKTGHPDYVPERGQQPYFKGGRRYWF